MGSPKIVFTKEEDDIVRAYWPTHTRAAIGAMIGRSLDAVKRRGRRLGLMPATTCQGRQGGPQEVARANVKRRPTGPPPSDADLVAAYLATKSIKQVPSGLAAGLSQMESQFWAVRANAGNWKDQALQQGINNGSIKK